jgi:hypothetical protein
MTPGAAFLQKENNINNCEIYSDKLIQKISTSGNQNNNR